MRKNTPMDRHGDSWWSECFSNDWQSLQIMHSCELYRATPAMMDAFWADGWRHFGEKFFRDMFSVVGNRFHLVVPLRIDVERCVFTKSQSRVLRKNSDVQVVIDYAHITAEKQHLFDVHKKRFRDNVPDTLRDFLSAVPSLVPCNTRECCVYEDGVLVAVSFFDMGATACSSVYGVFHPSVSQRSLGIFTLLQEIQYTREMGKKYLYLGYAHREASHYDYKKQFSATEFYNWQGAWLPLEEVENHALPAHPIEELDVEQLRSLSGGE